MPRSATRSIIHFQNKLRAPVTIHPHGILYSVDMDGAYKGKYTDPGGFVQKNETFDYVWEAVEGTQGAWIYHDHGPMDPLPLYKGLFGPLMIRDPSEPRPTKEFFCGFHSFQPVATGIDRAFYCINGRAYAGNTPTFRSSVGDDVAFYVYAIDDDFHTFHIHGHRWTTAGGPPVIDNVTLGPGDALTARFTRGQPGALALPLPRLQPPARGDDRLVHRRVSYAIASGRPGGCSCSRRRRAPTTAGSRSATTAGRTPRSSSTSASTSPGTGSAPT